MFILPQSTQCHERGVLPKFSATPSHRIRGNFRRVTLFGTSSPGSTSFETKIKFHKSNSTFNFSRLSHRISVFDPSKNPSLSLFEEDENDSARPYCPPPTPGRVEVIVTKEQIRSLDLSPLHEALREYLGEERGEADLVTFPSKLSELFENSLGFTLAYQKDDPLDPRELSELPDVRVWFVRADVAYPWLPAALDWRAGELGRYAAMLVPHQMSQRMGLVFNPEALEIWSLSKFFLVFDWLKRKGYSRPDTRVKDMVKILGFTIDEEVYNLLRSGK